MPDNEKEMPSRGFAKLDSGICDSSVWMKPHDALRVWIALLAKSDSYGIVRISAPALAYQCFVTPERLAEITKDFCSPDPDSRTPKDDGRRLQPIEGGWFIINYLLYRDMMQRKAASHAERQAKYREKVKRRDAMVTPTVTRDTEADSREQKKRSRKQKQEPPLPPCLVTPEFQQAWSDYIAYRKESKFSPLKPASIKAKMAELSELGSVAAVAAIRRSIANGWKGIFPETIKSPPIKGHPLLDNRKRTPIGETN